MDKNKEVMDVNIDDILDTKPSADVGVKDVRLIFNLDSDVYNVHKHLVPFRDAYVDFVKSLDMNHKYRFKVVFCIPAKTEKFKSLESKQNLQNFMENVVKFKDQASELLSDFSERKRIMGLFTIVTNRTNKMLSDYTFSDKHAGVEKVFREKAKSVCDRVNSLYNNILNPTIVIKRIHQLTLADNDHILANPEAAANFKQALQLAHSQSLIEKAKFKAKRDFKSSPKTLTS
jgi:hypothetical protein